MMFQSFVLFLTISLSSCMPQLNDGPYSYWRTRPRSIPSNAYYSNQPATYQDPQEIRRYDAVMQEYRPYVINRARGPVARPDDVKEVRIMNYPPETASMSDPMYNDQNPEFFFPGLIKTTARPRTTNPTKKAVISTRNLYIPDLNAILKKCAPGSTFCEAVDDYPSEYIHKKLQSDAESYQDLFGTDELIPVNISTRIGVGDGDGTPMCKANEKVIQPPAAMNAENQWKFIVNDDKYVQGIRVEICQNAGEPCAMSQNFPLSYETECKQKFIFRKLLALDPTGVMQTDNFRLPSCCVCVYRAKRAARAAFGLK